MNLVTYDVAGEAWLAWEWSVLKVCLHILWNELRRAAPELDPVIELGANGSVVLLDAVAATTPIQMQVDDCYTQSSQYKIGMEIIT